MNEKMKFPKTIVFWYKQAFNTLGIATSKDGKKIILRNKNGKSYGTVITAALNPSEGEANTKVTGWYGFFLRNTTGEKILNKRGINMKEKNFGWLLLSVNPNSKMLEIIDMKRAEKGSVHPDKEENKNSRKTIPKNKSYQNNDPQLNQKKQDDYDDIDIDEEDLPF